MHVNLERLGQVGIDRVVLNNLKILNFDKLNGKEIILNSERFDRIEKFEVKEEYFRFNYSKNFNVNNAYEVSSLEFNPNRVRDNHNVYNSSLRFFRQSLNVIVNEIKERGIEISLDSATIKELELNVTLDIDFDFLNEIILLIGVANYRKSLEICSFNDELIPARIRRDRTLYINARTSDFKRVRGKVIKIYDKTFEMFTAKDVLLDRQLTRVEVLFGQDYYRNILARRGLDNSLQTLLSSNFLKEIYYESLESELLVKPLQKLKEIKKDLLQAFSNFKRNEKVKREFRQKFKRAGKNVPEVYREERGVLEYLARECWIFDYSFLIHVINELVSSKHRKDYERQVVKKYMDINNLTIFNTFTKSVLGKFF